jgi:hypothetical protein
MAKTTAIVRQWEVAGATGLRSPLTFDGVVKETHTKKASISKNPMENGVSLADHAVMEPAELTLEIAISDTPLSEVDAKRFTGSDRRSVTAWAELEKWMAAFVPFDIVTGLKTYKNLLISSMSTEQDKDSGGALFATIQLQQVTFASTATVVYPAPASKKPARQASKAVDNGKKCTQAPTPAQEQAVQRQVPRRRSALSMITGKGA